MAVFTRNSVFGIALSRELLFVIGPDVAAGAGNWRAMSLGSNANGVPPLQVQVQDGDIGITCFPFDGLGAPPTGAPPAGARVQITFSPIAWVFGLAIQKGTLPGPQGIVLNYFSISTLGGATFAEVILDNGALIATLPEELSLLESP